MKIKRILSIFLVLTLSFGICTIAFAEENIDIPNPDEGNMPTLPPCEEVEVSVVYRPITSMISFANFGPFLDGMVLKVTYADGTSEHITITSEKAEDDSLIYVAGDYYVDVNLFNTMEVKSPGINRKSFYIIKTVNGVEYEGLYRDFTYLYIPSLGELIYNIPSLGELIYKFNCFLSQIFNPPIDFYG